MNFASHCPESVKLSICMGDTLTHLDSFEKVKNLFADVYRSLETGGKLYLRDTVYSFDVDNHKSFFDNLIDRVKNDFGVELACNFEIATREEYTTIDWIMEGLLRRAGFYIDKADYSEGFMPVYVCTKI